LLKLPTKNIPILILFLLVLASQVHVLHAQNNSFDLEELQLFSNSNEIVNGEKWVYTKKFAGHPFWGDDKWYKCDLSYKGNIYEKVDARFNIHTEEIILFIKANNEARGFILNKQHLSWFTFYDLSNGEHTSFQYAPLIAGGKKMVYTTYHSGETQYYVQYKKYVNNVVKGNYTGEYLPKARMFVERNGVLAELDSQKKLVQILSDRKDELKKFMRKNKIKFDRKNPAQLASVFKYYDSLITKK